MKTRVDAAPGAVEASESSNERNSEAKRTPLEVLERELFGEIAESEEDSSLQQQQLK